MSTDKREGFVFQPQGKARIHRKKSDQIAEEIKHWIVHQGLTPGDRLPPEQELAPWFGCGKGTVREALKSLEVQGLVSMRTGPKGGPILREPSYAGAAEQLRTFLNFKKLEVKDIYDMRLIVEPEMAVAVIDVVDEELLKALQASVSECPHTIESGNGVRRRELEFHIILAERCPNPLLSFQSLFISDLLSNFIRFENSTSEEFSHFTHDNCDYHDQIVTALSERNSNDLRKIMHAHMGSSKTHTLKLCGKVTDSLLLTPQDRAL